MIARRHLPLALASLALISLILGLAAPPSWQGLPAAGAGLLLAVALLERLRPRWRGLGLWQRPPACPSLTQARRRSNTTLHLLIANQAPHGQTAWQSDRDQALGFWQSLAASGNEVRLYGFDPELRLVAAATPTRALDSSVTIDPASGPAGDLKAALARLCSQARAGSILVVVAPLEESAVDWLARLDLQRRGLALWLVGTSLRQVAEPGEIRDWRSAWRYAEAWQAQIRSERLAARLGRRGIRWLAASETADLHIRLLRLWEDDGLQIAD
ncbi:hypothetical protein [Pseudomonas oryzihabitans]|nr:hypothetical protein [Pseudomonas oryzihabitans]